MAATDRTTTSGLVLTLLCLSSTSWAALFSRGFNRTSPGGDSGLAAIDLSDHLGFAAAVSAPEKPDCDGPIRSSGEEEDVQVPVAGAPDGGLPAAAILKLHLKHRSTAGSEGGGAAAAQRLMKESVVEAAHRDLHRIQTLHRRIAEGKNQNAQSRLAGRHHHHKEHRHQATAREGPPREEKLAGQLLATIESGASLHSGEYLADIFVGTPPRHFSVVLDTGSDLNWLQCLPCHDCYEQHGPRYDPALSSSYRPVPCADTRCRLVSSPDPPPHCQPSQPCPYFYWYGDRSNTTGDLALETFTVNLTGADAHRVENVIFGCGHWNRGLFRGAAGLLGLGRGPLSFSSQLRSLYGGVFSYCLVDRNSDLSVTSKLIFGQDPAVMASPDLNFTSLVTGKENPADTFYYVQVKGVMVGGELLDIPPETWELSPHDGLGGTIVDSGTTLSYFSGPAYPAIRDAVLRKVKGYPLAEGFPVLSPCYNVTGVDKVELPGLAVLFADGAVWGFPPENCFIRLEPEEVVCLAVLGTPPSAISILGNYQQQNFHVVYDAGRSRLGFAPATCADL
uniref:Aspartic proteinase nepenthesin-1 n=1 Tax=Anthurium amnicola TaxID=1678845 RepID=A0A1D1YPN5_9ARAE